MKDRRRRASWPISEEISSRRYLWRPAGQWELVSFDASGREQRRLSGSGEPSKQMLLFDRELRPRRCPFQPRVIRSVPGPFVRDEGSDALSAKPKRPGAARYPSAVLCTVRFRPFAVCLPEGRRRAACGGSPERPPVHASLQPRRVSDHTSRPNCTNAENHKPHSREELSPSPKGESATDRLPERSRPPLNTRAERASRAVPVRRSERRTLQPTVTTERWALAAEAATASTPTASPFAEATDHPSRLAQRTAEAGCFACHGSPVSPGASGPCPPTAEAIVVQAPADLW